MKRATLIRVRVGPGLVLAAMAILLTSCTTKLDAQQLKLEISPTNALVATPDHVQSGEVVVTVDNQSFSGHTLDLARLTGARSLPTVEGKVPDGKDSDLTYDGQGYTIVAKLEPLDKFSYNRAAPTEIVHQYLASGTYVFFDVGPGNYASGMLAMIEVS